MDYPRLRETLRAYHVSPAAAERIIDAASDAASFDIELRSRGFRDAALVALHQARRADRGEPT